MMPIFFHLESHLAILYLFFCNGLLVNWLLRSYSIAYAELTKPIEAQVLAAFFISISINGLLLLGLDLLRHEFVNMSAILPLVSLVLLLTSVWRFFRLNRTGAFQFEFGYFRLSIYVFVFIILFYNGGMIESVSDAWWHMSLASKIGSSNSINLDFGHLNGISLRYYPPLWHSNLAIAHLVSGEAMAILWNSFTPWGGVLKVTGFYLMALSLSKKQSISTLSALLFVFLPGMGDSYLRVSAWPSHIAYAAFFTFFYVGFSILDTSDISDGVRPISFKKLGQKLFLDRSRILIVLSLSLIILFTHQAELIWLLVASLFYWSGISVLAIFDAERARTIEQSGPLVRKFGFGLLLAVFLLGVFHLGNMWMTGISSLDLLISSSLPLVILLILIYMQLSMTKSADWSLTKIYSQASAKLFLLIGLLLLLFSIDWRHFLSLFYVDWAYSRNGNVPYLVAPGLFGTDLMVPDWRQQLRGGLLYSGVISIPLSLVFAYYYPSRLTVFLASTSLGAFLFCTSPYLYQWLGDILNYHSPWRIGLLIFHPIIIATSVVFLCRFIVSERS